MTATMFSHTPFRVGFALGFTGPAGWVKSTIHVNLHAWMPPREGLVQRNRELE